MIRDINIFELRKELNINKQIGTYKDLYKHDYFNDYNINIDNLNKVLNTDNIHSILLKDWNNDTIYIKDDLNDYQYNYIMIYHLLSLLFDFNENRCNLNNINVWSYAQARYLPYLTQDYLHYLTQEFICPISYYNRILDKTEIKKYLLIK